MYFETHSLQKESMVPSHMAREVFITFLEQHNAMILHVFLNMYNCFHLFSPATRRVVRGHGNAGRPSARVSALFCNAFTKKFCFW